MVNNFNTFNIENLCREYEICDYTINEDGSIDVDGEVILADFELTEIPIKFRNVYGRFDCSYNKLKSLKNSPIYVGGSFKCVHNKLKSLKYIPERIDGSIEVTSNELTSLKYVQEVVNGNFVCNKNKLKSLKYAPKEVSGSFACSVNELTSMEYSPKIASSIFFTNNDVRDLNHIGEAILIGSSDNPVHELYLLFKDPSEIELFNEYDIIRGDEVIKDRLDSFLMDVGKYKEYELKEYKLI